MISIQGLVLWLGLLGVTPLDSPRFIPLYWRIATSDAVVIGTLKKVRDSHFIVPEKVLRGDFKKEREFRWLQGALMPETEEFSVKLGERACFLLRERQEEGQVFYSTLQGAGSRGALKLKDPMPTFVAGVYELSLNDVSSMPLKTFLEQVQAHAEASQQFKKLTERYRVRPEGDSEVGATELYDALSHVRQADISMALERIEADLETEDQSWRRKIMTRAQQRLTRRSKQSR